MSKRKAREKISYPELLVLWFSVLIVVGSGDIIGGVGMVAWVETAAEGDCVAETVFLKYTTMIYF